MYAYAHRHGLISTMVRGISSCRGQQQRQRLIAGQSVENERLTPSPKWVPIINSPGRKNVRAGTRDCCETTQAMELTAAMVTWSRPTQNQALQVQDRWRKVLSSLHTSLRSYWHMTAAGEWRISQLWIRAFSQKPKTNTTKLGREWGVLQGRFSMYSKWHHMIFHCKVYSSQQCN